MKHLIWFAPFLFIGQLGYCDGNTTQTTFEDPHPSRLRVAVGLVRIENPGVGNQKYFGGTDVNPDSYPWQSISVPIQAPHRSALDLDLGYSVSQDFDLGMSSRFVLAGQETFPEYFFIGSQYRDSKYVKIRLDLGWQALYYFIRNQNKLDRLDTFVSGLGFPVEIPLGRGLALISGSSDPSSTKWDLIVNRMNGSNNTASITLPIGLGYHQNRFATSAQIAYRNLIDGDSTQGLFYPIVADMSWDFGQASTVKIIGELPGATSHDQPLVESASSRQIYDHYDTSLEAKYIVRL